MCNPLLAVAALTTLGSSYASSRAQSISNQNAYNVTEAERARQMAIKADAAKAFDASKAVYEPGKVNTDISNNTAQRVAGYNAAQAQVPQSAAQPSAGSVGGNQVVNTANTRDLGNALAMVSKIGGARAQLGGFGDTMFNDQLAEHRIGDQINQYSNFAKGSSNVLPIELDAARKTGAAQRNWAQVLSGVASIASGAAGRSAAGTGSVTPGVISGTPSFDPILLGGLRNTGLQSTFVGGPF